MTQIKDSLNRSVVAKLQPAATIVRLLVRMTDVAIYTALQYTTLGIEDRKTTRNLRSPSSYKGVMQRLILQMHVRDVVLVLLYALCRSSSKAVTAA